MPFVILILVLIVIGILFGPIVALLLFSEALKWFTISFLVFAGLFIIALIIGVGNAVAKNREIKARAAEHRAKLLMEAREQGFETIDDYRAAGAQFIPERRAEIARANRFDNFEEFAAAFQQARRDGMPLEHLRKNPPQKPVAPIADEW